MLFFFVFETSFHFELRKLNADLWLTCALAALTGLTHRWNSCGCSCSPERFPAWCALAAHKSLAMYVCVSRQFMACLFLFLFFVIVIVFVIVVAEASFAWHFDISLRLLNAGCQLLQCYILRLMHIRYIWVRYAYIHTHTRSSTS